MVVTDWGPIAREIAAQATAGAKAEAAGAGAPPGASEGHEPPHLLHVQPIQPAGPTITLTLPGTTVSLPGMQSSRSPALGFSPSNRLGGPKSGEPNQGAANVTDGRMDFLRSVHRSACKIFGTVLGPEANSAHKNHFHVDMAERPHGVICE
jgi:hypothetical protein